MKKSYRRSKGGAGEEEDKEDSILTYEEPKPVVKEPEPALAETSVETPGLLDKVKSWFGGSRNKRVRFRMTRKRTHKRSSTKSKRMRTSKRSSTKRTKQSSHKRSTHKRKRSSKK